MNRQINNNLTKHIRIDTGLHHLLKIKSAEQRRTIKELVEECLADLLAVESTV